MPVAVMAWAVASLRRRRALLGRQEDFLHGALSLIDLTSRATRGPRPLTRGTRQTQCQLRIH
jgi:hypothetical protein